MNAKKNIPSKVLPNSKIRILTSFFTGVLTALLFIPIQLKLENPILIFERFFIGGGWLEVLLLSIYAGFLIYKMQNISQLTKWRNISWTLFSVVFFGQLILGLAGLDKFLMTGKLHFPIPGMIVSGSIYRWQLSVMPILFLSTIVLSGPAWCSHLCYFGAFDSLAAKWRLKKSKPLKSKLIIGHILLLFFIALTIVLRAFQVPVWWATIIAGSLGIIGVIIIVSFSLIKGKMVHCVAWCPIGILMNYLKFINPFRMYIDDSCTNCLACTKSCRYDALNKENIQKRKPGISCRLCGECLSSCHTGSVKYKFFKMKPENAHKLYLIITVVLHAFFLGMAKI